VRLGQAMLEPGRSKSITTSTRMRRDVKIRPAELRDLEPLALLRAALWPESSASEHAAETRPLLDGTSGLPLPLTIFVAEAPDGRLIGFVEVDLRSHADGCDPAQPVGFLEGWFVAEDFRQLGIGGGLVAIAEEWARAQGCVEIASDTWIDSAVSQSAHEALGYEVVDRCVHYRKAL
jgi:aminoglycoside 6'-N-acetyltransferase I